MLVSVEVNGQTVERDVEPRRLLVHFLREDLRLTGTHIGCETGYCGACTVLVDGEPAKSCLMLAAQSTGRSVTTIEGVAPAADLHPVQEGFRQRHGLQCGFCTPGMVLSALALLEDNEEPTEPEIRAAIDGNLCRCTGYQNIVAAVEWTAAVLRGEEPPAAEWDTPAAAAMPA